MTARRDRSSNRTDEPTRRRVAVVASWYPVGTSPSGIFIAQQVAALRRQYDITVVAPERRGLRHLLAGRLPREPGDDALRPVARTWVPRSDREAMRAYESAVERSFRRIRDERGGADLIHAHVVYPAGLAAVKVGRRHGVPVVLTEHASPFGALLTSRAVTAAVAWTLEHADRVLAVGETLRREMLALVPNLSIEIVGNVIDTDFFAPSSDEAGYRGGPHERSSDPLRLLTIGVQQPQKGIDLLLEAVARLSTAERDIEVVVAGEGNADELRQLAERLGVDAHCRFVGALTRFEVRDWLRWCDLYVSASRFESFGVAIAEALACGRPVVVTRSGGPEGFVDPAFGVVVEPDDAVALAAAIEAVATGSKTLDAAAGRRAIVERFGPDAFLARIATIYDEVIAARRRPAEPVPSRG